MDIREVNEDVIKIDISINSTVEDLITEFKNLCTKNNIEVTSHSYFILKDLFFREIVNRINRFI